MRHVARTGERREAYRIMVGKVREGDYLVDACVVERIILRWIFMK